MVNFKPGDTVRRLHQSYCYAEVGHEYVVASCNKASLKLIGDPYNYNYIADRFELVVSLTPAEMFETLNNFVKTILREPPMRVGNIYRHDDTGVKRTILCIHNDYVWLSDEDGVPFTGHARVILEHYTRIAIQ